MRGVVLLVAVLAVGLDTASAGASGTAFCGADDKPETGYQGQTPLADMATGRSQDPYYCGLRIVGHSDILNRGANWQLAKIDQCAYMSTIKTSFVGPNDPVQTRYPAGIAVIDVDNPTEPEVVEILRHPGGLDSSETMHAVQSGTRKVLAAGSYSGGFPEQSTALGEMGAPVMDIYDASDCTHPKHMATYQWPANAHTITIAPGAERVYGTGGAGMMVLDIKDMQNPKLVGNVPLAYPDSTTPAPDDGQTLLTTCHTVEFNADETRMYCAGLQSEEAGGLPAPSIWDASDFKKGVKDPKIRFVGQGDQTEDKPQGWHHAVPAMIDGRPHIVAANELAPNGCESAAYPQIWDMSDERHPRKVGQFRLEVQDHCGENNVEIENRNGHYATHYNNVDDNFGDTKLGLWGWVASGVRIVDLRDPTAPREIAYFKPGANPVTTLINGGTKALAFNDAVTDACGGYNYWNPKTEQIWMSCMQNGFFVAELSPTARRYMGMDDKPMTGAPPAPTEPLRCQSRVRVRLRVRRGRRPRPTRATIRVDGKAFKRVRLRPRQKTILLKRLPRGTHRIVITARTRSAILVLHDGIHRICRPSKR